MNTSTSAERILIADDEPLYLKTTAALLRKAGYECECVSDADAAVEALRRRPFSLILSDLNMPGNLKLELLHEGRSQWPDIPLIVVTGVPSLPTAIESVRLGIADYLLKPVKFEDLLASVRRVLDRPAAPTFAGDAGKRDPDALASKFPQIIGNSASVLDVLEVVDRIAATDTNVLITGESGTGKEVVARAIHSHSQRRHNRFEAIDCTAIPENLFESVVFGHAKGSFTGAVRDQEGLLSQCDRGTAFLDELAELPLPSQAKLLRAVQERTFTPVGKQVPVHIDTRFVCATNRDLNAEVNAGRFRRDLYYRLGVIHIELPPLRARGDDIVLLAEHFLRTFQSHNTVVKAFSDEAMAHLRQYDWPGNIRELRNVVERSIVLARSAQVQASDLPKALRHKRDDSRPVSVIAELSRDEAMDNAEHSYLASLLEKHAGNISQAAHSAGLSRQGMHKLLKKHGIVASDYRE